MREVKERISKRAEDEAEKARNALRKAEIAIEKKKKRRLMLKKDQNGLSKGSKHM